MKQVKLRIPKRILALFIMGLFLSVSAFAQIAVKGHVKDATGEAVIGATVRIVGQQGGTVTDFNGDFSLSAKSGQQLQVSFVGYKTATVAVAPSVVVTLQDDAQVIDNVVVIGYGRAKKNDLTGSVTAMKPDEMSKGITNNASDMMVGKIAGVDVVTYGGSPGAGAQIRIRGGSSLNATNDPLIVIDGLAIDNSNAEGVTNVMAMVNPNDIESMTVLKDASATAIYGSRASNGVIIITTKKGAKNKKLSVKYNGDVTISTIQKKYDVLDGDQYRDLVAGIDGLDASTLGTANTNWQDQVFRMAISTSHNLSVEGNTLNTPFRVSVGYNDANGIIKNSWMHRFNAGINFAPSFFKDHLKFNVSAKYMHEENSYVDDGDIVGAALSIDPTRPVYSYGPEAEFFGGWYQPSQSASYSDPDWKYTRNPNATENPLARIRQKDMLAKANDFNGIVEADYQIHGLEDLHIHASYGGQYTECRKHDYTSPYSGVKDRNYYGYDGMVYFYKYSITANAYAQYQKELGAHYIDIMAGTEESHFHRNGYSFGQGTDPYNGEAYNPSVREETGWATRYTLLSYFGRLNYTLLDRYMLTATLRADGSSRFAENNRWGYFPSVALAWKINEEKFMKNLDWWNEFKLRLGWGKTGQQEINQEFGYMPLYTAGNAYAQYPFGDTYYYTVRPNAYNPDLKWETTTTWNAGLDFGFLNNRITASVDGYYRETTDLLNTVTIPAGTNFGSSLTKNIGSLENYGVEFTIDAKPIVTKNFRWDISYNVSWNHNEITKLTGGTDEDSYRVFTGKSISRGLDTKILVQKVGYPMNSFYVYQQVYDENGKPIEGLYVDRDGNGQINEDDRYIYKKPAADVIMGLTTKFIYKNWDLSASFRASFNNYIYYDFLSDRAAVSASGLYSNSAFRNTTPEAVELGFTGTTGNEYYLSDYFVRNASFLKCTNITLGYSFPHLLRVYGKPYLSGRVFVTAQNPFIITKYKGLDPEKDDGVDKNPYPRPMSFQLGLNLNF